MKNTVDFDSAISALGYALSISSMKQSADGLTLYIAGTAKNSRDERAPFFCESVDQAATWSCELSVENPGLFVSEIVTENGQIYLLGGLYDDKTGLLTAVTLKR